jgi:hypothetical protein
MLPIRWIFLPVVLVFAIALLPRAFVAAGFPAPEKRASESHAQTKLQDRFIPGSDQRDQLMSLPEPAQYLAVSSSTQDESDLTRTVEFVIPRDNSTLSAIELPVATSALDASRQTKSAKREDHRTRAASSGVRHPSRTKLAASGQSTHDINSIADGQIPAPNFTFSAY